MSSQKAYALTLPNKLMHYSPQQAPRLAQKAPKLPFPIIECVWGTEKCNFNQINIRKLQKCAYDYMQF